MSNVNIEYEAGFPLIATAELKACTDFYTGVMGFSVVADIDWYVQLRSAAGGSGASVEVAYFLPESEDGGSWIPHNGEGLLLTLQTQQVDRLFERVIEAGMEIVETIKDEDWGQRHFIFRDPSGTLVDVVKEIEPSGKYSGTYTVPYE